MFQVSQFEQ